MDEVITFDKSLQERLQEYQEIFAGNNKKTVYQIKQDWIILLELNLDPNGWQALWKIPRLTCEEYKITFPTIVLVYVENINFSELLAIIKVIAVQDEISLPDQHLVPLLQLWPTKDQDKSVYLNIHNTANYLDMYRFFYTHIYLTFDSDEDDNYNWIENHLESRLRLFYDMKNGTIPRSIAEHISFLLTKAKRLGASREQIEQELIDSEVDEADTKDERIQLLMDLNVDMIEVKGEFELLENPVTRNVILKRNKASPQQDNTKQQFWLIFPEGKIDASIQFLGELKKVHPDEDFKFFHSLSSLLHSVNTNDIIILNNARHSITSTSAFEDGGYLKGIGDRENTILQSTKDAVMLDFRGSDVILENITIEAKYSKCAILVRAGKTVLKNCKLIGDSKSSTNQGIIVLKGACLELINCDISGFGVAIVGNSKSTISIEKSEIHEVKFAVKIFDNCTFKAQKCNFHDCQEYGFCMETFNGNHLVGSFELLQVIPDVTLNEVSGENNLKGDVLINNINKLAAKTDLFFDPKLDPTKQRYSSTSETSEEDMEVNDLNSTVVERFINGKANTFN